MKLNLYEVGNELFAGASSTAIVISFIERDSTILIAGLLGFIISLLFVVLICLEDIKDLSRIKNAQSNRNSVDQ